MAEPQAELYTVGGHEDQTIRRLHINHRFLFYLLVKAAVLGRKQRSQGDESEGQENKVEKASARAGGT